MSYPGFGPTRQINSTTTTSKGGSAEKLIKEAMDVVGDMPSHSLLTDAISLLAQARERVTEYSKLKKQ